jgi:uncharacterized 2Fe-2S/4Fe-4S cluster protein (DUF4445 family)
LPTVHFTDKNIKIEVPGGTSILKAAKQAGIMLESPCNAMGTCGKCKVMLSASSFKNVIQEDGIHKLSEEEKKKGMVLSCQTRIYGNIDVKIIENNNKSEAIIRESIKLKSLAYKIKENAERMREWRQERRIL